MVCREQNLWSYSIQDTGKELESIQKQNWERTHVSTNSDPKAGISKLFTVFASVTHVNTVLTENYEESDFGSIETSRCPSRSLVSQKKEVLLEDSGLNRIKSNGFRTGKGLSG